MARSGNARGIHGMQVVWGSNPHSSTFVISAGQRLATSWPQDRQEPQRELAPPVSTGRTSIWRDVPAIEVKHPDLPAASRALAVRGWVGGSELIGLNPVPACCAGQQPPRGVTEQNLPGIGYRCPERYAFWLRCARMKQSRRIGCGDTHSLDRHRLFI